MICSDCGGEFKNIGAHKRFCKPLEPIIIDEYMGKSLSFIIEGIRQVLKSYNYELDTNVKDKSGEYYSLEMIIRIPLRR